MNLSCSKLLKNVKKSNFSQLNLKQLNWVQQAGCKPNDTGVLELQLGPWIYTQFSKFWRCSYMQTPVVLPECFKSLTDLMSNVLNNVDLLLHSTYTIVSSGSLYAAKHTWRRHQKAKIFLLDIYLPWTPTVYHIQKWDDMPIWYMTLSRKWTPKVIFSNKNRAGWSFLKVQEVLLHRCKK